MRHQKEENLMMKKIKRYEPIEHSSQGDKSTGSMIEDECGDWVSFEDYEKLISILNPTIHRAENPKFHTAINPKIGGELPEQQQGMFCGVQNVNFIPKQIVPVDFGYKRIIGSAKKGYCTHGRRLDQECGDCFLDVPF